VSGGAREHQGHGGVLVREKKGREVKRNGGAHGAVLLRWAGPISGEQLPRIGVIPL
jgi:hypothetical protein